MDDTDKVHKNVIEKALNRILYKKTGEIGEPEKDKKGKDLKSESTRCPKCGKIGVLHTKTILNELQSGKTYKCTNCGYSI